MKNNLDGGEAVVEAIRNLGIEHVIMAPGSEWSPVWEALTRQRVENVPGPAYMQIWHETLAVNIATGYSFMTGLPQAVLLHAGVGPMQGMMAINAALQSEIPMLVLAGESVTLGADPGLRMEAQWYGGVSPGGIDRLIAPAVKWSGLVPSAPTLYRSVVRAGEMAQRAPRGPVFLDVPLEYMLEDWSPEDDLRRVPPASTTLPVAAELDGLVDEIAAARNPVVVTEFSGREPGAFEALVDFAEAGAIPVIGGRTAFYGNFPTDHDLWQGVETYAHLADADLVLLVGARTPWYPPTDRPTGGRIVSIGDHPHKEWLVYQVMHADAYLEGDIAATLSALAARLRERGPEEAVRRARRERWAGEHAALTAKLRAEREAAAGGTLDTLSVCRELERAMPADTVYVDETISHFLTMRHHLPLTRARSLYKLTVSGLGQGLGLALGMKLGAPERPVVAVVGDGSFLYNPIPQAFGAARDYGLPVVVLIMNNRGYRAMLNGHRLYYADGMARRTELTLGYRIDPPAYEEMGAPFGIAGARAETGEELAAALERGLSETAAGRSYIVNAVLPE